MPPQIDPASSPSQEASSGRRRFFKVLLGLFGTVWGTLTLFPIYRYLRPSQTLMAQSNVTSVSLGKASSLPVGQGKNFQFGSIPGIIVHTPDGQFHAFNAICTHLGCTVQYRPELGRIWCACHGGQYNPETGQVLAGPPPRPLAPLKVALQNDLITVSQQPA